MVPEFNTEAQAWAWMAQQVADEDFIDNYRLGYIKDFPSFMAYARKRRDGCCGYFDREVRIAGKRALIGCNFGH